MSEPDEEPERGTSVIMHINEEEKEFLASTRICDILEKYCYFLPIKIFFKDVEKEESQSKKDSDSDAESAEEKKEEPINDIHPLWQKNASDCTDDEYKEFYHRVFGDYRDPLFWIHISADYPLNFRGILYFPKLINEYESLEGQIKLYYNQVFVADNIKEIIPEHLLMLRGVLDCPELPLNVSRSYLQNSGYVTKMSQHMVKKVADKLNSLYNTEREKYEKIWDDIKTFVEYGCLRDSKFYDRVKGSVLLPLTDGRHVTIDEYLEKAKEKHKDKIYYASDKTAQAQYIAVYEKEGIEIAHLETVIDTQFITIVEHDKNIKFLRVDAEVADVLKGGDSDNENKTDDRDKTARDGATELFRRVAGDVKLTVKFEPLRDAGLPAVITEPEHTRRIDDMMKLYGIATSGANYKQNREVMLTLNTNNALINRICSSPESETSEDIARHIWSLARLTRGSLTMKWGLFLPKAIRF
jgi:molecular chaperone HtpG